MRWFFLFFLMLLALAGNAAALDNVSVLGVFAAIAFNLFIAALVGIWWNAYYRKNDIGTKIPIYSALLFMTSLGCFFILIGAEQIRSESCDILTRHSHYHRHRFFTDIVSGLVEYIEYLGYCRPLGFVFVCIGLFVVLDCFNRFVSVKKHY